MKIHPLNYESYALPYLEGTLSKEEKEAFERFLEEQPQIAEELEGLTLFQVHPDEEIVFPGKEKLLQPVESGGRRLYLRWAIAASWLLLLLSGALWMQMQPNKHHFASQSTAPTPEVVSTPSAIVVAPSPTTSKREERQTPKYASISQMPWHIEEDMTMQHESFEAKDESVAAQKMPSVQALQLPNLPASIEASQPLTIYMKPVRLHNGSRIEKLSIDNIAIIEPLKNISPKQYKSIRDFNIKEDVLDEIDGKEIVNAFTPELFRK